MRLILSFILCLLITSPLFTASSFANDYETGKQAYNTGDYKTAYEIWLPLAKAGNDKANIGIGNLYRRGLNFEYDFAKAEEYYYKAFGGKSPSVFYNLGKLYIDQVDNIELQKQGLIWLYVSKNLDHPLAQNLTQIALKIGLPQELLDELEEKGNEWIKDNIPTR
ncbi:SEL1-like repeat protein [Curvivirga aplysinae]|uniref:sel1 repeat family protein n=1 Tax=Curvivirga aplysinae TaxID=2529852 RepID=UPI0012BCCB05|nr:sel1 repeat family protein [Curvivirga aplysinae]MTI08947.1 sel1 repeat family protein [Curvivirga aplysinae]